MPQFSIVSSYALAADLSERISTLCTERPEFTGPHEDTPQVLRICVAEALNNIVKHAYGGAPDKPISVSLDFFEQRVAITLMDEGCPMPGGKIPETELDFDETDYDSLPEGGFGWILIRSQMDAIKYERRNGCNVLRLEKWL